MRAFTAVTLLVALIAAASAADNWLYTAQYEDASCSADKWLTYTSIKINSACSPVVTSGNTTRYLKFDCGALTGLTCTDDKCTQNCVASTDLVNSAWKTCTGISGNKYVRAFCGDVSSPHPGLLDTQAQVRTHLPSLDCTGPMILASGFRTERCLPDSSILSSQNQKYSCGVDGVLRKLTRCNADCSNCGSTDTIANTCTLGFRTACGVGSASGVVVSVAMLVFSAALAIFVL